jgi:hypothetical protein
MRTLALRRKQEPSPQQPPSAPQGSVPEWLQVGSTAMPTPPPLVRALLISISVGPPPTAVPSISNAALVHGQVGTWAF